MRLNIVRLRGLLLLCGLASLAVQDVTATGAALTALDSDKDTGVAATQTEPVPAVSAQLDLPPRTGRVLLAQSRSRSRSSSTNSSYNQSGNQQYQGTGSSRSRRSSSTSSYDPRSGDPNAGNSRNSRRDRSRTSRRDSRNSDDNADGQSLDNSRKDTSKKTSSGGGGGKKAADEIEVTGANAQSRTKTSPKTAPKPGGKKTPAPKKAAAPRVQRPTLFAQSSDDPVMIGDTFRLQLELLNPKRKGFDRLEITLQYDPEYFEFVPSGTAEVENSLVDTQVGEKGSIRDTMEGRLAYYANDIFPASGVVHYVLELHNETSTAQGVIGIAEFRGLQEVRGSRFDFLPRIADPSNPGKEWTSSLTLVSKDVLGDAELPTDGYLNEEVGITTERERRIAARSLNDEDEETRILNTRLRLWTPRQEIVLGEEFDVYVDLANPDADAFDAVALLIAYNPRVIAVVDHDQDNGITQGINIHDGAYREDFPFDYAVVNEVDATKGVVDYRMRVYRRPLRAEGTLAAIRFRALATTRMTTLRLLVDLESEEPTTGLFYRFNDVLGDGSDPADALTTTSIMVGRAPTVGMASP